VQRTPEQSTNAFKSLVVKKQNQAYKYREQSSDCQKGGVVEGWATYMKGVGGAGFQLWNEQVT